MNAASDEEAVTSVGTRVYLIMFRLYKQSGTKTLVASASTTPKLPVLLPLLIILTALVLLEVLFYRIFQIFSVQREGCRSVSLAGKDMNFHPVSFYSL